MTLTSQKEREIMTHPKINPTAKLGHDTEKEIKIHLSTIRSSVNSLRHMKFTFKEMETRMNDFGLHVECINDNVDSIYDSMEEEVS